MLPLLISSVRASSESVRPSSEVLRISNKRKARSTIGAGVELLDEPAPLPPSPCVFCLMISSIYSFLFHRLGAVNVTPASMMLALSVQCSWALAQGHLCEVEKLN